MASAVANSLTLLDTLDTLTRLCTHSKHVITHPALLTRMLRGPERLAIAVANFLTLSWLVRSRLGPTSTLQPGWAALQ